MFLIIFYKQEYPHPLDHIIGEFHSLYNVSDADIVTLQKNITTRLIQNEGPGFLELF